MDLCSSGQCGDRLHRSTSTGGGLEIMNGWHYMWLTHINVSQMILGASGFARSHFRPISMGSVVLCELRR